MAEAGSAADDAPCKCADSECGHSHYSMDEGSNGLEASARQASIQRERVKLRRQERLRDFHREEMAHICKALGAVHYDEDGDVVFDDGLAHV